MVPNVCVCVCACTCVHACMFERVRVWVYMCTCAWMHACVTSPNSHSDCMPQLQSNIYYRLLLCLRVEHGVTSQLPPRLPPQCHSWHDMTSQLSPQCHSWHDMTSQLSPQCHFWARYDFTTASPVSVLSSQSVSQSVTIHHWTLLTPQPASVVSATMGSGQFITGLTGEYRSYPGQRQGLA